MRKTTGARECSRIERSGVDAGERKEKAARPQRGKSAPRRKETKKNGGRKGGVPYKGRSAARVEEEFMGGVEEES